MSDLVLGKQTELLVAQMREVDANYISPWAFSDNKLDDALDLVICHERFFSRREFFTHARFIRESLRTALLRDLHNHFFAGNDESEEKDTSAWGRIKLTLIGIAGTVYNICNGFDVSVSILNLFVGIPFWTVFAMGLALSSVFVVLFYGVDFVGISENLHLRMAESRQLLDLFHHQTGFTQALIEKSKQNIGTEYKQLLEQMDTSPHEHMDLQGLMQWLKLMEGLTAHQAELYEIRARYMKELDQYYVHLLKWLMTVLAGILYFNSGFFVGQVFAALIFSAFISTSVSMLSWPVMLISCSVGLAALLSVFWFSDRMNVENLVGRWIGLDIDKIQQLPDDDLVQANQAYLKQQKQCLSLNVKMHERWLLKSSMLSQENDVLSHQPRANEILTDLSTGFS